MEPSYKFCLISFHAGSRGAFLGKELWQQYPQLFQLRKPPVRNEPLTYNGFTSWHTYNAFFANEIFYSHPKLNFTNLLESEDAQFLDKHKYNIVLVHHYDQRPLRRIQNNLSGHTVKTIQIVFDQEDILDIHHRGCSAPASFGHPVDEHWKTVYLETLQTAKPVENAIYVDYKLLKDDAVAPDLSDVLTHLQTLE